MFALRVSNFIAACDQYMSVAAIVQYTSGANTRLLTGDLLWQR